jgi:two-component system cell cycle sensor histidine kinase/response regulator CckA
MGQGKGEGVVVMGWSMGGVGALKQSRLLDALPLAVFGINASHKVVLWNRACQDLTGIAARDVLGTSGHWKAFYREQKPTVADALVDGHVEAHFGGDHCWGDGEANASCARFAAWQEFPSGQRRYILVNAVAVHSERGDRVGSLVCLQDLTELQLAHEKEVADQTRRGEALKMDALSRMAGGIAHDFNNLLTAVLGYARLVKDSLGPNHPLISDVDEILHAGERGSHLTQLLLAISRKRLTSPKVVRLSALLADLLPSLRQLAGENIRIHADCGNETWPIMGDPALIEQVILPLAENARDSMPNGGSLRIVVGNETVLQPHKTPWSEMPPGQYVRLTMEDTGCGMPANVMAHLFEPFFTTKEHRHGMGLAVVWGILHQMKAHIDVTSVIGGGTRFDIFFPIHSAAAEPVTVEKSNGTEVRGGNETILVVEDEDIVRHLVVFMLKSLGYRVLEASDGREAFKIAARFEGPIHLILTDVVMPHVGGLELVKQLRPLRKDFKVLYMSGFTDGRLLDQGLLESDSEIILKPYTRESLARKVRAMLDRKD